MLLGRTAAPARAADIPVVTVTPAGPDKSIPTDAAFYVAGTAKDAKRAQVLIVRTGTPWIWHSDPPSCGEVNGALRKFVGGDGGVLPELYAQTTTADKIWRGGDASWPVKVSPSAVPDATGAFKILVDHDDFFGVGHAYCVYVYVDRETPDLSIADALVGAVSAAVTCSPAGGCTVAAHVEDKITAQIATRTTDPKLRDQLTSAVIASIGSARTMAADARDLELILDHWAPGATKPYNFPVLVRGRFASAVAALLAYNNQLLPVVDSAKQRFVGYFTRSGTTSVKAVGFVASGQIRVADVGETSLLVDAKSADLAIPDSSASLRDIVELASGRLPLGKDYLAPAAYHQRLAPILESYVQALTAEQSATLTQAHDSLLALHQTLVHIHDAYDGKPRPTEGSKAAILWDLGDWLETIVETECDPKQWLAWGQPVTPESGCRRDPGPGRGWATYINQTGALSEAPLALIIADLEHFKDAQAAWLTLRPTIQNRSTSAFTTTISTTIEVTRQTWVFSYLSPVIGYAIASPSRDGSHEGVTLPYFAVQLHLKPNPEHLPTGGIDMFALELGAAPGIGSYGPDQRYRGFANISPLFVGLAVHLIPYTALSTGVLIGERRSSTVVQEDYHTFGAGYVGLTVDFNIPQLVVGSKTTTTTTAASTAAGQ